MPSGSTSSTDHLVAATRTRDDIATSSRAQPLDPPSSKTPRTATDSMRPKRVQLLGAARLEYAALGKIAAEVSVARASSLYG